MLWRVPQRPPPMGRAEPVHTTHASQQTAQACQRKRAALCGRGCGLCRGGTAASQRGPEAGASSQREAEEEKGEGQRQPARQSSKVCRAPAGQGPWQPCRRSAGQLVGGRKGPTSLLSCSLPRGCSPSRWAVPRCFSSSATCFCSSSTSTCTWSTSRGSSRWRVSGSRGFCCT